MDILSCLLDFVAVVYNNLADPSDLLLSAYRCYHWGPRPNWWYYLKNPIKFLKQLWLSLWRKKPEAYGPKALIIEERIVEKKDINAHFLLNSIYPRLERLSHNGMLLHRNIVWFHHVVNGIEFDDQLLDKKYARTYLRRNMLFIRRFVQRCYIVLTAIAYSEDRQLNFYYYDVDQRGVYDCKAGYACCAIYRGITSPVQYAHKLKDAESLCCLQILNVLYHRKMTYWLDVDFPDVDIAPDRVTVCYPSPFDSDDSD